MNQILITGEEKVNLNKAIFSEFAKENITIIEMKKVLLLLIFSLFIIGCGSKTPTVITKTEYLEFPLPLKYSVNDIQVKMYKEKIKGQIFILVKDKDFYEIYKRYNSYKLHYESLYKSIVEFNNLKGEIK